MHPGAFPHMSHYTDNRFGAMHELLHTSPWFPRISPHAQQQVCACTQVRQLMAGEALCRRGDVPLHWYGIISGLLKWSTTTADGHAISYGGMSTGSWIGEGTLCCDLARPADIIALQPTVVVAIPRETFDWLCDTEPSFTRFLLRQISERMFWFIEGWGATRTLDAGGQVRRALAGLFHPWLFPHGPRHITVSQEEIANLAGVSRPRCNRALKELEQLGILKLEYGGLTVLDLDELRRLAST
ncbi:Crp/Fnr family transcription regulator [Comamonas thiooxydans]|nr:Crp/Fnr family transcription regulator [Comamonas thiooxydans]